MTDGEKPAWKLTPRWKLPRALRPYRADYEAQAEPPAYEDGTAFRVQVQSGADLAAREPWRIDAWENPFARDGPASPFLAGEPMLEAEGCARAVPLVPFHAALGGRVDGLRLLDGTLIVKIEQDARAGPLPAEGGARDRAAARYGRRSGGGRRLRTACRSGRRPYRQNAAAISDKRRPGRRKRLRKRWRSPPLLLRVARRNPRSGVWP